MVGTSSVEVPGEGSAAGSAKRKEPKSVEKERSHKRQTPTSVPAETTGPGDQTKKEEKRGRKLTERNTSEKSGRSRSRRSSSSLASANETKRGNEPSALPSSPSTARSTAVKAEEECGQNKKERRRRSSESRSSVSSRTPTARKPSKERSNRRQRSSQSTSSEMTLVEAPTQHDEATKPPATREMSSAKESKRRKRGSSSTTVLVTGDCDRSDNEKNGLPRTQQITAVSSAVADAERVATQPSSGTGSSDTRENAVAAPCYDIPAAAMKAKNRREGVLDEHKPLVTRLADTEAKYNEPTTEGSTVVTHSKNGVRGTERRCSDAEAEGSASEGGVWTGRKEGSARRRGEESKRAVTVDELPRRHHWSTTEEHPSRPRLVTEPSPPAALGVEVIDEGDKKHLVLTAGETPTGDGKPGRGSGSDRSRGGSSSSRSRHRGGSRSSPAQNENDVYTQRQERGNFRENIAKTVPARGGDVVNPTPQRSEYVTDAFEQTVVRDDIASEAEEKQQPDLTSDHHPEHPLMFSRKVEVPAQNAPSHPAAPSNSSGSYMAPSFSITTKGCTSNHVRDTAIPPPCNRRPSLRHATPLPDTRMPGTNPCGALSSPTSSISSSPSSPLRGRPVSDRTAKYVTHQASFHADISDDYFDLNSPLGTARGGKGAAGEETEMGKATSSLPAEKSTRHNNAPVVSSSRLPRGMVWEASSRGDRQTVPCGMTPESTVGNTKDLLASSPAPSAAIPAGPLAGEDGNARLVSNQPGSPERDGTPSPLLSQDRLVGGSEEDDGPARGLLHFRTDAPRHLVSGGRPELFFLRPNESLGVTRIEGSGRLLVTVREEAGAAAVVVVDRAIVHDSAAHFGHAAIQTDHRFPYVAGHRYEFQVEPAQGVELTVRGGGDRLATPSSQGSKADNPATGLHVVFSVTSAYTKEARLGCKDAALSSLPTFEAPSAYNSQQPDESQSSTAATASAPVTAAESNFSTKLAPEQKPTPADVRRSPSPSVAAVLIAPCISPPPPGTDNLAALRSSEETSTSTPGAPVTPAPAAAAKPPAGTSSNRTVARVGGVTAAAEGFARGGPPQSEASEDRAHVAERNGQLWPGSGVESDDRERNTRRSEQDVRERSSPVHARTGERSPRSFVSARPALCPFNAQEYREKPEGAMGMMGGDQPSAGGLKWNPAWEQPRQPTLPYIRRHVEHTSPRSAFEQQSPSGGAGNFATRDSSVAGVGADRFVRQQGYFVHEPPTQRKRHAEASRAEDESRIGYHPQARERTRYGTPLRVYHSGYASDVHSSVAIGREHHMPPDSRSAGGGSHWGERSRWREDEDEGWARKSERNVYPPSGHAYQPINGRGHYRGEDPRRYQSDYGGGINNASPPSDSSSHRGYKIGNGIPPSGKETAKMMGTGGGGGGGGASLSDPSRGRALARGGVAMGRGRRDEHRGVELTEHGDYRVGNGGCSERLPGAQARRGVDSVASRESKERRKRTPHRTHNDDPHQPVAYRKSRHTLGTVHQTGSTAERVPPRWIKF